MFSKWIVRGNLVLSYIILLMCLTLVRVQGPEIGGDESPDMRRAVEGFVKDSGVRVLDWFGWSFVLQSHLILFPSRTLRSFVR